MAANEVLPGIDLTGFSRISIFFFFQVREKYVLEYLYYHCFAAEKNKRQSMLASGFPSAIALVSIWSV